MKTSAKINGAPDITTFDYKMINGQIGTVLVYKNHGFLLTLGGLFDLGETAKEFPTTELKMGDLTIKPEPLDFSVDQVIDGMLFAWQEGAKWWLMLRPNTPVSDPYTIVTPYLLSFKRYR